MIACRNIMLSAVTVVLMGGGFVQADEGMWVFNNLPLTHLKEKYGFEPTPAWINQLRSAAVRFNSGGSGSFVSTNGLVMTNHHVGADTLQKISTKEHDYYKTGFHAKTLAEEVKAPDLELNVLVEIKDVTDAVNAKVGKDANDADAAKGRRQAILEIEKASQDKTGLRSDVVTLYQGGQYHLYTFKKYTDVRLVFAPEFDAAFFGGDPDNFEYPRYDLDVCFFRAYENDKPAKVEHILKWSPDGSKDGELVFVAGHPGRTSRLNTLAHLEYLRDTSFPLLLDLLRNREAHLAHFGKQGDEQARQAKEDLFGIQNSLKARLGGQAGLNDQDFMARKGAAERALRDRIQGDPQRQAQFGAAWDKIARSLDVAREIARPSAFLERGFAFDSALFSIARTLVRFAAEDAKPNAERLREYGEAGRDSLEQRLYSEAPIYPEFEISKLANSLAFWQNTMGDDDPVVRKVLQGRTPKQAAEALVKGSKLADVAIRRQIAKGGAGAIETSDDPMIQLARLIDADARALRTRTEDEVEGVQNPQYALIAKALFEDSGDSTYPDATFTLRLAFGTVKGYEFNGKVVPPFTTIGGGFDHAAAHGNTPPYQLPPSWFEAKAAGRLRLNTPLNFISTADIIGGNSGSPVTNQKNEVVGLIFDGNMHSLVLDFGYDDKLARAVSVDSRGIMEALRSIYQADDLVRELTGRD
ncbi:MAG: S46 family peptidase [Isosphaeraceae bacterium]